MSTYRAVNTCLVGAFSVIVKKDCETDGSSAVLVKRMAGAGEEDKIVNGYETDAQPWLASFVRRDIKGNLSIACGGALINRRYVM